MSDDAETVVVSRNWLWELGACALRAELDARNAQPLQEQVARVKDALARAG
jgi:hypothetical protein